MLTFLGISMIMCFMYLIMSKRLSALVALILIPFLFAIIAWGLGFYFEKIYFSKPKTDNSSLKSLPT